MADSKEKKNPDKWERWNNWANILKGIGGFLTPLVVAFVGILGSDYISKKESVETNVRLYAELMSGRERADSDLRKEMFNSIIEAFMERKKAMDNWDKLSEVEKFRITERNILALELVAYNFHDVIDIGPLFKHVERTILNKLQQHREDLMRRLIKVAHEVNEKQIATLGDVGVVKFMHMFLDELDEHPEGVTLLEYELLQLPEGIATNEPRRLFTVEVLGYDRQKNELRIRLEIAIDNQEEDVEADHTFNIGFFDFPMIDNTRLENGQRVALGIRRLEEGGRAEIWLAYFPGSRASLKEKPYYDEVLQELVRTRLAFNEQEGGWFQ